VSVLAPVPDCRELCVGLIGARNVATSFFKPKRRASGCNQTYYALPLENAALLEKELLATQIIPWRLSAGICSHVYQDRVHGLRVINRACSAPHARL